MPAADVRTQDDIQKIELLSIQYLMAFLIALLLWMLIENLDPLETTLGAIAGPGA